MPEQEKDKPAARGPYAELAPEPPASGRPEAKRDVSPRRTADDIRAAFAATREMDAGDALQEALADRGIGLAAVSPEEAYASERQAAFAREIGRRGRTLGEGEIVAVDGKGNAYRLDERVTGEKQAETEARLAGVDRAALPDLAEARQAMREASRAAWRAQKEAERAEAHIREPVTGVTAEIRTAFTLAPDSPDAALLQEALAARGVTLAQATAAEAAASETQAARYAAWNSTARPKPEPRPMDPMPNSGRPGPSRRITCRASPKARSWRWISAVSCIASTNGRRVFIAANATPGWPGSRGCSM